MTLAFRVAFRTDPGRVRESNEDACFAGPRLLVVADGVGGMPAGELASEIAVRTVSDLAAVTDPSALSDPTVLSYPAALSHPPLASRTAVPPALGPGEPGVALARDAIDQLQDAFSLANARIREAAELDPSIDGMGTTVTAMLAGPDSVAVLHVGDSRAYLLRDGELRQLTVDDSYVQMLVQRGVLTPEEAARHPHRNLVTQVMTGGRLEPAEQVVPALPGDRYLLCSDGLSDVVPGPVLAELLAIEDPEECVDALVREALLGGGPDNITAIVADAVWPAGR